MQKDTVNAEGEKRVIQRLVAPETKSPPIILATGGGAFTHEVTRNILNESALTVWLKGDIETLVERVMRNDKRPLLQVEDPRAKMVELLDKRSPTVNRVLRQIQKYLEAQKTSNS